MSVLKAPPDALFVFVRLHARLGQEAAVEALIREVIPPTRAESGNLSIHAFLSVRDAREFYIHSRWRDEGAFELHSRLDHTRHFIESVVPLLDQELHVSRMLPISGEVPSESEGGLNN